MRSVWTHIYVHVLCAVCMRVRTRVNAPQMGVCEHLFVHNVHIAEPCVCAYRCASSCTDVCMYMYVSCMCLDVGVAVCVYTLMFVVVCVDVYVCLCEHF